MSMIASQWYRIDKGDGKILAVNSVNVLRAASGAYKAPNQAINAGRFSTPFAIYTRGDRATEEELNQPRGISTIDREATR